MATHASQAQSRARQAVHVSARLARGALGLVGGIKYFLFRKVPGDTSWLHTLGSATLTAFLVQAVTGVILAMYYKPDPQDGVRVDPAHHERHRLGWLVRGMHRWGASVFIILMFFHMARVFLFGAYKYPRELNWIVGVLLLALGMFEGFTGYLLPCDQTAYWATVVGDQHQRHRARSSGRAWRACCAVGPEIGPDTLSRFYSIHMLLVPGALIGLIGLHLYLVIRLGVTSPPWSKEAAGAEPDRARAAAGALRPRRSPAARARACAGGRRKSSTRRAPRGVPALQGGRQEAGQAVLPVRDVPRHGDEPRRRVRDHRARGHLEADDATMPGAGWLGRSKADPGTTSFVPRPDWYFYFLFYLLRIFKWPDSVILGTVGIPTICLVLLLALPFIDMRRERRLSRRPVAVVAAILTVLSMGVLTYKGATAKEALASEDRRRCRAGRRSRASPDNGGARRREAVRPVGLPELPHVSRHGLVEPRRAGSHRRGRRRTRASSSRSTT